WRIGRMAALVGAALTVEIVCFLAVNYAVGRPRPEVAHLGSTPSTFSFPSGHIAASLVLYGSIAIVVHHCTKNAVARLTVLIVAFAVPLWVAFSRVYRGEHHLTDVIAGALMGAAVVTAVTSVLRNAPAVDGGASK